MMKTILRFFQDVDGATASEYSIMVALIAMVIIGSVLFFGGEVKSLFEHTMAVMSDQGI